MPSAGALKRRKKLKEGFKWLKNKILDPILKKLSPLVQKFLKSKFGSSMSKFATWLNQTVIQKDKFGIMNAIKDLIPYGQYLEKALKIAGNFIEQADWNKVGEFIEKLVYNSDKQEEIIDKEDLKQSIQSSPLNNQIPQTNSINTQQTMTTQNINSDSDLFEDEDDDDFFEDRTFQQNRNTSNQERLRNMTNNNQNVMGSNFSRAFGSQIN